jgi:type IV secretory pathway TrbD component
LAFAKTIKIYTPSVKNHVVQILDLNLWWAASFGLSLFFYSKKTLVYVKTALVEKPLSKNGIRRKPFIFGAKNHSFSR